MVKGQVWGWLLVRMFALGTMCALWGMFAMGGTLAADDSDAEQRARDETIIQTLLRLDGIDVGGNPKLKETVLRYLKTQAGTPRYLELVERFDIQDVNDQLLGFVLEDPASTLGVNAARLLLKFEDTQRLTAAIHGQEEAAAISVITALGHVGNPRTLELLVPLIPQMSMSLAVRSTATQALARSRHGQLALLELVQAGELPADLNFTAANVLHASQDDAIRTQAAQHLALPATADAEPLPPLSLLLTQQGDALRGQQVFNTHGTCAKCHLVRGTGKEVGPDLSEIGSKLSKEAMYVSILDPSAGISHSYETYTVILDSGNILSGILVSQTDEQVTIKTAEAIVLMFAATEVEELRKQTISLMPADLQKQMTVQDLVDVVEYLGTLRKLGE